MDVPRGVKWKAMTDVMRLSMQHASTKDAIHACMDAGHVNDTLAFHRELLGLEAEFRTAFEVCRRTAGEKAASDCMKFAE